MSITLNPGEIRELNATLQPIPIPPASLVGVVIDANTSLPLKSVRVVIIGLTATTTASNGSYSIANIPPGSWKVQFSKDGYETVEY